MYTTTLTANNWCTLANRCTLNMNQHSKCKLPIIVFPQKSIEIRVFSIWLSARKNWIQCDLRQIRGYSDGWQMTAAKQEYNFQMWFESGNEKSLKNRIEKKEKETRNKLNVQLLCYLHLCYSKMSQNQNQNQTQNLNRNQLIAVNLAFDSVVPVKLKIEIRYLFNVNVVDRFEQQMWPFESFGLFWKISNDNKLLLLFLLLTVDDAGHAEQRRNLLKCVVLYICLVFFCCRK